MSNRSPRSDPPRIAVVVPCYNVAGTIADVLARVPCEVQRIICVDDASTDDSAAVIDACAEADSRVRLLRRSENGGVGAAVVDGYRAAIADGAQAIVKLDADGQMDPGFVTDFVRPILIGEADYVKGNRFFTVEAAGGMPMGRLVGNAGLSLLSKVSTGYWTLFDPTNGYTAIHAEVASALPLDRLHKRYFFESDMLFRLGVLRARVLELPHDCLYAGETSHLSELKCLTTFPVLHLKNICKRVFYNYILRNFSIASVNLFLGLAALLFGGVTGAGAWVHSASTGTVATAGTVMLSALPFIVGVQLLLNFLSHDMAMTPHEPVHPRIRHLRLRRQDVTVASAGAKEGEARPSRPS